ncbi:MAG: DUF429 domain-containing protein [Candidatus Woesearchaeota archaeon]|nr:DUF429 domain-containing protein [Candidatus Woesearchaeota archaeon]
MKIIGIDLAVKRNSDFCIMNVDGENIKIRMGFFKEDKEIVEIANIEKPDIITIDSPLSFPKKGNLRKAEKDLKKRKIKFFPPKGMLSMEKLTERGIRLKNIMEKYGLRVVEVFPGAFKDMIGIPRKDRKKIVRFLEKNRINIKKDITNDGLDAVLCALTGKIYLEGEAELIGNKKEGQIVVPNEKYIKHCTG